MIHGAMIHGAMMCEGMQVAAMQAVMKPPGVAQEAGWFHKNVGNVYYFDG